MWISKEKWNELQRELQSLRTKAAVQEALSALHTPPRLPTPEPEKPAFKPIDEQKTRRLKDLLDSTKGTKWQRYKRQVEQALKVAPAEVVVNTPATTEK